MALFSQQYQASTFDSCATGIWVSPVIRLELGETISEAQQSREPSDVDCEALD